MASDERPADGEPKPAASENETAGPPASSRASEPGAPIPKDAVDDELLRLSVPLPRRHPSIAIAVLIVGGLLLFRLRADLQYALEDKSPRDFGNAVSALKDGKLDGAVQGYVALRGLPDRRNALAIDPKGARGRTHVFQLLGTDSRLVAVTPVLANAPASDEFRGRLVRFDDLSYADTLRGAWKQSQVLRAVDLSTLRALPPGPLSNPPSLLDRAGRKMTLAAEQELLIDVLFEDDLRVLLSKDKFPSEADARYEVERLGLAHGPCVETKTGYGYVLRLPEKGPERQRVIAQADAQGMFIVHRIETYRVPAGAVQLTPAGLQLPGPDALQQPVRYQAPTPPAPPPAATDAAAPKPTDATATAASAPAVTEKPAAASAESKLLLPIKGQSTQLLFEQIRAVQITEPLTIPANAFAILDGETPREKVWTLPLAAVLALFLLFNVWYLARSLKKREA